MKLRLYTNNNLSLLYLSPYVTELSHCPQCEQGLILRQELFNTVVIWNKSESILSDLLELLDNGIKESSLVQWLSKYYSIEESQQLVRNWMKKGIIE